MKINKLGVFTINLFLSLILIGCNTSTQNNIDYKIAILETSATKNMSKISIYNAEGTKKNSIDMEIGDINSGFLNPFNLNNTVYLNSLGTYSAESTSVIEINTSNFNYEQHKISYGVISVCADDKYIFTSNSPPIGSVISKYDKEQSKVVKTLTLDGFVTHINSFNDKLYAFAKSDSDDVSFMYIIDKNLFSIEYTQKLPDASVQLNSIKINDSLYFTNQRNYNATDGSSILSRYDIINKNIENIDLNEKFLNQIIYNDKKIYVSHFDPILKEGNKITIIDPNNNNSFDTISFKHNINQFFIKDDFMLIIDDLTMYIYDMDDFSLKNKFNIKTEDDKYYISGFFIEN